MINPWDLFSETNHCTIFSEIDVSKGLPTRLVLEAQRKSLDIPVLYHQLFNLIH